MRREVYDIAAAYYETIRSTVGENWHPLSSHVNYLVEAGTAAVELQALGISVATEGIAGTCFPNLAPVAGEFRSELTALQERLPTLELSREFERRMCGALVAMATARNSDRIRAFVADNSLEQRLFESWQRLRNTSAHGSRLGSENITETLGRLNDVLYLAYAMILEFIGYGGVRTDCSSPDFPDIVPPSNPAAPPS